MEELRPLRLGLLLKDTLRKKISIMRKPYRRWPCSNLSGYSYLLRFISFTRFGKWISRRRFLNDHLEEDIYTMQPDGFIAKQLRAKSLQDAEVHLWTEAGIPNL